MGDKSPNSSETDAIKDQNSTLELRKLGLCFQHFNDFGIIYLHRKSKKPRIELLYKQTTKKE
jgi:hypothetical protein